MKKTHKRRTATDAEYRRFVAVGRNNHKRSARDFSDAAVRNMITGLRTSTSCPGRTIVGWDRDGTVVVTSDHQQAMHKKADLASIYEDELKRRGLRPSNTGPTTCGGRRCPSACWSPNPNLNDEVTTTKQRNKFIDELLYPEWSVHSWSALDNPYP